MNSVAELIGHLERAQMGAVEIEDTPVLQAVNRQLAYRAKASKKAHQRVMQRALTTLWKMPGCFSGMPPPMANSRSTWLSAANTVSAGWS